MSEPFPPSWARPYLPAIPDDAEPIWKSEGVALRGEFLARFVAYLIDGIPMIALMIGIFVMNRMMYFIIGPFACLTGCFVSTLHLLLNLTYFFYVLPLCNHRLGGTWGKKVMKLRVVPNGDPRGRITMANAVLRQLGHLANFGIGYLLALGEERKAVEDYVGERVLEIPRAATEVRRDAAQGRGRSGVSAIRTRPVTQRCARRAPSLRAGAAGVAMLR